MRRGPLLVDMVLTEPAMPYRTKKDVLAELRQAAGANDLAAAGEACRRLVNESRTAPLAQAGKWELELKALAHKCRSIVREVLEAAGKSVGEVYRVRALESDVRPEEVRKKADKDLLEAAEKGDLEGVKRALAYGADVHAKDGRGLTAMLHAMGNEVYFDIAVQKYPEVVEFLREYMLLKARNTHDVF